MKKFVFFLLFIFSAQLSLAADLQGRVAVYDRSGNMKSDASGVVVFLDELEYAPTISPPVQRPTISQTDKQFNPQVLPVVMGTTVDFPNDDKIFHNVFSLSRSKNFDLGIYEQGNIRSVTFDQPGLIKVYCNIHPQMFAFILVLGNSYFTVTDQNGNFYIPDVPLGKAKVRTWHARSRNHPEQSVDITPQGIADLEMSLKENLYFEIKEETFSIKHKNKWGMDYPSKY